MVRIRVSFLVLLLAGCDSDSATPVSEELPDLRFASNPPFEIGHNEVFEYRPLLSYLSTESPRSAAHPSPVGLRAVQKPDWLALDTTSGVLTGMPGVNGFGRHRVILEASRDEHTARQAFDIQVVRGDLLFDGTWIDKLGRRLGHDGLQVESDNFVVFSDFSSPESRLELAGELEQALIDLKTELAVDENDFNYLPSQGRKIHIYADYDQTNMIGLAYRDGIILRALDSPGFTQFGHTLESTRRLIRHELMHVVEFFLIGRPDRSHANSVWLREGFANYISGPRSSTISSEPQLQSWIDRHAGTSHGGNPIAIINWGDFPPGSATIEYYPLFELACAWLFSDAGGNRTIEDLKSMYDDLGSFTDFEEAFNRQMELDLEWFELNFFDLMKVHLPD